MTIRTPIDPAQVPVAIFASVMGTAGLGLAWRIATATLGAPAAIAQTLLVCGALIFVVLTALYAIKTARSWALVVAEYRDASSSSYFATIIVAIGLLAYAVVPVSRTLAIALWAIGALGGALLLVALTGDWISGTVKTAQITPVWFIPAVGNAATVAAGVALGFREIAFASFAFGIVCWLTLLPLVSYRLIFAEPLPQKAVPSLAVLISSPAVLALAWLALNGGTADWVFRILVFKSVFFTAVVVRLSRLAIGMPFSVAWWGYTFPTSALAAALLRYHQAVPGIGTGLLAIAGLAIATVAFVVVAVYSLRSLAVRVAALKRTPAT